MAITLNYPNNIVLIEDRVTCTDCNRWEYLNKVESGSLIKHDKVRCDFANSQASMPKIKPILSDRLAVAAKSHRDGANVDFDTIVEAYKSGHLSMSDAMNSDF